jgi:phycobilisome core component
MDYYLRYATYAIVASDTYVLDERVLQGLRETYNSLGVPIGPTVRGIQIMKGMIADMAKSNGMDATAILDQAFDHLSRDLSEKNI